MANQTITTDSNHDDLTGRSAGENITINQGATLTIDSMPQETAMGILGLLQCNEGLVLIDGRQCKQITYDGGSGTLPAVGDTINNGTQTGTAKLIEIQSGAVSASGTFTVTLLTGTFDDDDSISSGGWSAAVNQSTFAVGYMRVFGEDQTWSGTALGAYQVRGAWYELGTGDGNGSQTFTLPHEGTQAIIWVETGNGTGVFEKWFAIDDTAQGFSDYGDRYDNGRCFAHDPLTDQVRFGTSGNGGVPANGAILRIPNTHLGTTDTTDEFTENHSTSTANTYVDIGLSVGYPLLFDKVNFSTFRGFRFGGCSTVSYTDCCGTSTGSTSTAVPSVVSITNCGIVAGGTYSVPESCLELTNVGAGVNLTDCLFVRRVTSNNQICLEVSASRNITISDCKFIGTQLAYTSNRRMLFMSNSSDITFNDPIVIAGEIRLVSCSDFQINNIKIGMAPKNEGSTSFNGDCFTFDSGTNNVTVDGIELIDGADFYSSEFIDISNASDITIRNMGAPDAKVDCGNRIVDLFSITGAYGRIDFQRLYLTNTGDTQLHVSDLQGNGPVTFQDVSVDYDLELEADVINGSYRSVSCASGPLNSSTGVEGDLSNVSGTHFYSQFTSDTTGSVGLIFNATSPDTAGSLSIDAGTPVFNGFADLLMRTVGDQITYTFPWDILGHAGFQNAAYEISGVQTGNIDIEYALDTGSGFGAFKAATGANLSAETIAASGFGLKIRLTANASNSSTTTNGLRLFTNTTIQDQKDNKYSIDTPTQLTVKCVASEDVSLALQGVAVVVYAVNNGPFPDNTILINGLTDAQGGIATTVPLPSNQDIGADARQGTTSPFRRRSLSLGTMVPGQDLELSVVMPLNE